ncbi:hypothetical protein ACNOYE_05730 [Nannocystaceae bacterium ST9]
MKTYNTRIKLTLVATLVGATAISSLAWTPTATAQNEVIESEAMVADPTVTVALVGGALAAYAWTADKLYDLGKEVGKWLAGSSQQQMNTLADANADYLLD